MTCTGTHTVTQADIDAGTTSTTACVDDGAGAAQACAPDDVPAVQTKTLSITKDDNTASYDHVGQVITYTIVATNTGNVPQVITVSDDAGARRLQLHPGQRHVRRPGRVDDLHRHPHRRPG